MVRRAAEDAIRWFCANDLRRAGAPTARAGMMIAARAGT